MHPPDHIKDSKYFYRRNFLRKKEWEILKELKTKVYQNYTTYIQAIEQLRNNRIDIDFSTYMSNLEVTRNSTVRKVLNITYETQDNVVLKKFRGNTEVYDIYTKDNRIFSLFSTVAHYPSPSAPYNISRISIMMFGLMILLMNRPNRLFLLPTILLNWSG